MKLLIDVCVSIEIVAKIAETFPDYDIVNVYDIDCTLPDVEILELANQQNRIVITEDKDFGDLVFKEKLDHKDVFLLRGAKMTFDEKTDAYLLILEKHKNSLPGNFVVFSNGSLRIK